MAVSGIHLSLRLPLLLLLVDEGRETGKPERPADPHSWMLISATMGTHCRDPLAPHPRHLSRPPPPHVRRHLGVVPHQGVGPGEEVLLRRLLLHPHESRLLHPPAFLEVPHREDALAYSSIV